MDIMKKLMLLTALVGVTITAVNGQCSQRDCGTFCCPPTDQQISHDSSGFQRTECCNALSSRTGCCSIYELQTTRCPNGITCPGNSGLDPTGEVRNQCCLYFRNGCCSLVENRDLQLLFNITIGLVAAGVVVILATILLIVLCCCCICC